MDENKFNTWPHFCREEIDRVRDVLISGKVNYWTGDEVRKFENEFAQEMDCDYAVALANGTVALELALRAAGIGKGDEVIVTPRSFLASASCIVICGARPIFADVDPVSQNITAESIQKVMSENTRAVICVHLAGWPCDMDSILALAQEHNLYVIEDCAQAHGAKYKGRSVGSFGHAAAWSFCQDKIMTTGGEGGMLTTNNRDIWKSAWSYKDHGKSWDTVYNYDHPIGFRWLHETFGTNFRMTEMQAAIGRVQLKKLSGWVKHRRDNAAFLNDCFKENPFLRTTQPGKNIVHSYYHYYIFVRPGYLNQHHRDHIMQSLSDAGIPCKSGICPEIYLEKVFDGTDFKLAKRLPVARELGETSLMFPVHPLLSKKEMEEIAKGLLGSLGNTQKRDFNG